MGIAKIKIRGAQPVLLANDEHTDLLNHSATFELGPAQRALGEIHQMELKETDVVEFVFQDNISWMLAPEGIKELFGPGIEQKNRATGELIWEIPDFLPAEEKQRGIVGDVALKLIKVFRKKDRAKAVKEKVKYLAEHLQKTQLDQQSGLYKVEAQFTLVPYTQHVTDRPILLFLHGTASSTRSSFGELVGSPAWDFITQTYADNILAFQHETLTKSPLQNVFDLVMQLPQHCVLHLISHSRGGLVGDVLSRFCGSNDQESGFAPSEIAYLKKCQRTTDCQLIEQISQLIKSKNIRVERFVRVACPASGTTLAAQRMDHFFNVVVNVLGLAVGSVANPIYAAFKDLLSAVLDCKEDLEVLPGLEAMNPDSPFLKVLNNPAPSVAIDGQLLVISGNSRLNLSFKSLVVIASKLFFNTKNDLVVDTASMYNGAKRSQPVQCFFDEQPNVDHFHYFANKRTNEALLAALKSTGNTLVPGFTFQAQQFSQEAMRNAVLNLEGGQVFKNKVTGKRPIAVVLPGIMGSNLSNDGDLIWINYLRFIGGQLKHLNYSTTNNASISAPSLVKTSYRDLVEHLSGAYDVVTFPFDWRRPLNESAAILNNKLIELLHYNQSIKIVAHSMGGVLVRDFILQHNDTWQRLNNSSGFRLLFLGSPLGGSFRIPYVLFGFDEIISKLAKIDLFHTKKELLEVFCNLPGLLNLLPLNTDVANDFAQEQTWKNMREMLGDPHWPIPSRKCLDDFGKYRDSVIAKMQTIDWSNAVYIAGRDESTPMGYTLVNDKLQFLHTAAGDQSVTWDTGIPNKMTELNNVYYATVSHGALSCSPAILGPISDILSKGHTSVLTKNRPQLRALEVQVAAPHPDYDLSPQGIERTLLGLSFDEYVPSGEVPIKVTISNGDLRFARYPVFVGHFTKDAILNAEKAIDRNLKGALSELHRLGLYPGAIGTSEILMPQEDAFKGAVIVGLGEQGSLTAFQLTQTIEQAVAKFLVSINNPVRGSLKVRREIGISTLLIGCGFGGLSVDNSVRAILQGVQNANKRIKLLKTEEVTTIDHVEFVELYEDKALSSLYALYKIAEDESQALNVQLYNKGINKILGSKERLPVENTEAWWTRITVRQDTSSQDQKLGSAIQFNIATGAAREEERQLLTSPKILDELLQEMSVSNRWSPELAKTIFELLIPNDFKEQLKRQNNINWIVNTATASIPWELLQDEAVNAQPLAVNAGMIRQLATQDYRVQVQQVSENNAFVLADPDLKGFVFQLPGAKAEGELVERLLSENGFHTHSVSGSPGHIIKELFCKPYKIIHLAGHGIFNPDSIDASGMLIGNDVYLSTREIAQMSSVPELVVVNCCYLGKVDGEAERLYQNRYKLAANIGTQLISIGVKAVVVAGWAVDDAAALDFTKRLYNALLEGYNFGESVLQARKEVYRKYQSRNNTWGAYQCYGDPFYKLTPEKNAHTKSGYRFVLAREAEIELHNLCNKLELAGISEEQHLEQLEAISAAVDSAGLRNAKITEAEAIIYSGLRKYQQSVDKYASLINEETASFSFAAMEQYSSVRLKNAIEIFATDQRKRKACLATAHTVIRDLELLKSYSSTSERLILLGSAHRRLALLVEKSDDKIKCYEQAALYYWQAYQNPKATHNIHAFCSWINMEQLLVLSGKRKWSDQLKEYKLWTLNNVEKELLHYAQMITEKVNEGSYWDMVAEVNIKSTLFLLGKGKLSIEDILLAYRTLWDQAGASGKKQSEIEVCALMIDALHHTGSTKALKMAADLMYLKSELMKLL